MKTAMQELIEKIITEQKSDKTTKEQKYILIWVKYMAEELLKKEKQLSCEFAKEYINGNYDGWLSDYYDEKFEQYYNQTYNE
jgi:hypothetical protein